MLCNCSPAPGEGKVMFRATMLVPQIRHHCMYTPGATFSPSQTPRTHLNPVNMCCNAVVRPFYSVFLRLSTDSCLTGEDTMQIPREAYGLPACLSDLREPRCLLVSADLLLPVEPLWHCSCCAASITCNATAALLGGDGWQPLLCVPLSDVALSLFNKGFALITLVVSLFAGSLILVCFNFSWP